MHRLAFVCFYSDILIIKFLNFRLIFSSARLKVFLVRTFFSSSSIALSLNKVQFVSASSRRSPDSPPNVKVTVVAWHTIASHGQLGMQYFGWQARSTGRSLTAGRSRFNSSGTNKIWRSVWFREAACGTTWRPVGGKMTCLAIINHRWNDTEVWRTGHIALNSCGERSALFSIELRRYSSRCANYKLFYSSSKFYSPISYLIFGLISLLVRELLT